MDEIKSGMFDINGVEICVGQKVYAPYVDPIFHATWGEDLLPNRNEECEIVFIGGCVCVKYEDKCNVALSSFDTEKSIEVLKEE